MENPEVQQSKPRTHGINIPLLFTLGILIIVLGLFAYYYSQASGNIASGDSTISQQASQISSLDTQLASVNSQLSTSQEQLTTASAQLESSKSQVAFLQLQASQLQTRLADLNSQIGTLQDQLSVADSDISTLQSQLTAANAQSASLQSQLTSANSQIATLQSIAGLSLSSAQASSVSVLQPAGGTSTVVSFSASYAGYVVVSGTSSTANGYIRVTDSYSGYPYNTYDHAFGTGATLTIPVLPGTVTVIFGNTNLTGTATATISVVYYY
jgi:hypothetical protein